MMAEGGDVLEKCLNGLQQDMKRLSPHHLDELCEELRPLESAKLKVSMAYSLASLQFILLQLQGTDTQYHPIHDDLSRIRDSVQTINDLEKRKQKMVIDEEATARMIQFELSKNVANLASVGQAVKKQKRR